MPTPVILYIFTFLFHFFILCYDYLNTCGSLKSQLIREWLIGSNEWLRPPPFFSFAFLLFSSKKKFWFHFIFIFVFIFDCSSLNSFSQSSSSLRIFPKLFNYHETVKIQHDVLELIRSELELCTHMYVYMYMYIYVYICSSTCLGDILKVDQGEREGARGDHWPQWAKRFHW